MASFFKPPGPLSCIRTAPSSPPSNKASLFELQTEIICESELSPPPPLQTVVNKDSQQHLPGLHSFSQGLTQPMSMSHSSSKPTCVARRQSEHYQVSPLSPPRAPQPGEIKVTGRSPSKLARERVNKKGAISIQPLVQPIPAPLTPCLASLGSRLPCRLPNTRVWQEVCPNPLPPAPGIGL